MFFYTIKSNFLTVFYFFITCLIAFTFAANIAGSTSTIRSLDGGLGLLHTPLNQSEKKYQNSIRTALLSGNLDVQAQFDGAAAAVILAQIFDFLKNIITGLIRTALNTILNFIKEKIMSFIGKAFEFLDKFIEILEQLASVLSATRAGVGFIIYNSLQFDSNTQSSRDFAVQIIEEASKNISSLDLFIGERGENIITDTVTWLDFMSVQSELQSDTVGIQGVLKTFLGVDVNYFEDVKRELMYVMSGISCNNQPLLKALGPFSSIFLDDTNCFESVNATVITSLDARENSVRQRARAKVETIEQSIPINCSLRYTIKYTGGSSFEYETGRLTQSLSETAKQISLVIPTPEECDLATTGNKEKREVLQRQASDANNAIGATGGTSGAQPSDISGILEQSIDFFTTELTKIFDQVFGAIKEKFNQVVELVTAVLEGSNIGLQLILFNISVNVGIRLYDQLDGLSKDISNQLNESGSLD